MNGDENIDEPCWEDSKLCWKMQTELTVALGGENVAS
jgi:hypothetical protein